MKCAGTIFATITLAYASQLAGQECQPGSLGGAVHVSSIFDGNGYDFCVTQETVDDTPSWFEDDDYPPVSPRGAARSAKSELAALVNHPEDWTMNEVELIPAGRSDKWAYVVSFLGPATNPYGGAVPDLRIPVLMDGTAVTPHVSRIRGGS